MLAGLGVLSLLGREEKPGLPAGIGEMEAAPEQQQEKKITVMKVPLELSRRPHPFRRFSSFPAQALDRPQKAGELVFAEVLPSKPKILLGRREAIEFVERNAFKG